MSFGIKMEVDTSKADARKMSAPSESIRFWSVFRGTIKGISSIWLQTPSGIFDLNILGPYPGKDPTREKVVVDDFQPLKAKLIIE